MDRELVRQIADVQADHWWYEGRRRILRSVISRLNLPKPAQLLEAGCGTGANLPMLKEFGEVKCFEPDGWAREAAMARYGISVSPGALPAELPFDGPFDMVGAFDVIEHIDDDVASLKALRGALKEGGAAVFTVPAYKFLWSRHDDFNQHKRRYTRPQFRKALDDAGFRVEFISYYNTFLFPAVFGMRMIKKLFRIRDKTDMEILHRGLANRLLLHLFSFERHLLKCMPLPFGVSIIAVCRK